MKVIDDVLTEEEYKKLYDLVMSPFYAWYWNDQSTGDDPVTENGYNYSQFVHIVIGDDTIRDGVSFEALHPLFLSLGCKQIYRCKLNLNVYDPSMGDKLHGAPHVDMLEEMNTAIYYVNETDGDTFFFEDEVTRISPKPNRAVTFNSMIKHAGAPPKLHKRRVVININYK